MKSFKPLMFFVLIFVFVLGSCGTTPATNADSQGISKIEETKEKYKVEQIKEALDKAPQWVLDNGESENTSEAICRVGMYNASQLEDIIAGKINFKDRFQYELRNEWGLDKNPDLIGYSQKMWYFKFTDTLFLLGCADREKSKPESLKTALEGAPQWVLDNGETSTDSLQICATGTAARGNSNNPKMKASMERFAITHSLLQASHEIVQKIKAYLELPTNIKKVKKGGQISKDNFNFVYDDNYIKLDASASIKAEWNSPDSKIYYALVCLDRDKIKPEIKKNEGGHEEENFNEAPQWVTDGSASIDTPEKICGIGIDTLSQEEAENILQRKLLTKIGKDFGFFVKNNENSSNEFNSSLSTENDMIIFKRDGETLTLPSSAYVYETKDVWHFQSGEMFVARGCLNREKIIEAIKKTYDEIGNDLTWSERSDNEMDWNAAKEYCENLNEGGFSDWRLPNIDELRTLIKDRRTATGRACRVSEKGRCLTGCWSWDTCAESCNGNWDKCTGYDDGRYSKLRDGKVMLWSSSIKPDQTDYAWNVNFYDGSVSNSDKSKAIRYVRCVRQQPKENNPRSDEKSSE